MSRVKRGNKRRLKRKKILRRAKGYYLAKSKLYRIARFPSRGVSEIQPAPPNSVRSQSVAPVPMFVSVS